MLPDEDGLNSPLTQQAIWLSHYKPGLRIEERGIVLSIGDGIVRITGLHSAAMNDILTMEDGSQAMVFDLTEGLVSAVLLHETSNLTAGTPVHHSNHPLSVPVGDRLLGRIIDPLGSPHDGEAPPIPSAWQCLDTLSPPIIARDFVNSPLYTGIKIIDTLIPIGKGQRQLLIGDEGLGRSALALDTVINQKNRDVRCVYVLIGQRRSIVTRTIEILREFGALEYTTVVVAEASSLPGLQHLAPFSGCAIAEYWMQQGHDTLVVYDDLSTHAKIYRELSLLLRRPPGREAYPGDIFSVHASLLERTTCLSPYHGGGSMTALPIVETKQGEIADYIPTNLISITDGQIYLDRGLFSAGFRPAIDIARSVSRIGGQAQHPRVKAEAGSMKLNYLQFLELESFTRFGARLEASMEEAIQRGLVLREILKQEQFSPFQETFQLAWLVAFNDGHFKGIERQNVQPLLDILQQEVESCSLTLDSPREAWSSMVASWLSSNRNADETS
ncbi:Produces ATP from ADP in the presence of a proton gradient across the membrane. The alpha chain is a regulatory subunit [Vibrio sp. B1FLJ16]|uniref:F0F1 ATP synthase subunit alpha n=1 Tax=Vibrio sp. B1FLJ16 TaxID=2751178 RepID=UPI0015F6E428|nr:F0F1 ATP synthase subunit alpha [Vibrio sp. B1FLJ16]CAD7820019.1 Produces ATP from ADP in the presence of a proton gradient across the membrane. The alpha chain is a regulatory subunit [Vibrio sp. B1FLJ16]CAE6941463.1 Produces ATP from ADP in the presence of a proton gradient across the membrane. The alpha chain is a regulatory subunit [Vibrio sp. B1FLJ16]